MRATSTRAVLYCLAAAAVVAPTACDGVSPVPWARLSSTAARVRDGPKPSARAACRRCLATDPVAVLRVRGGQSDRDDDDSSDPLLLRQTKRQGGLRAGRGRRTLRDAMRAEDTGGLGWVPREDGREENAADSADAQQPSDEGSESDDLLADKLGLGNDLGRTDMGPEGRVDVEGLDFGDGVLDEGTYRRTVVELDQELGNNGPKV